MASRYRDCEACDVRLTIEKVLLPIFQRAYEEIGDEIRYPGYRKDIPSSGCCFVTAAVVQRLMGGEVYVNKREHSFVNVINGIVYDLTSDQYGFSPPQPAEIKYVPYTRKMTTKRIEPLWDYVIERIVSRIIV